MPLPFSPSASFIHRLRRIAPRLLRRLPRPRWAIRRCPYATPADGQPLMSTSSGLRLTARRGRLTLKPQADFRDSLSVDCVNRHPSALFTPSRQRSFGCLTCGFAQHRHHRPSPRSAPRLDRCICVKGERCFRVRSNPRAEFPRARKRFYRASVGVALHIPRGSEGGAQK